MVNTSTSYSINVRVQIFNFLEVELGEVTDCSPPVSTVFVYPGITGISGSIFGGF